MGEPIADDEIVRMGVARAVWADVANGKGKHGDFLKSFAEAYLRADGRNVQLLKEASFALIFKYKLDEEMGYKMFNSILT